MTTIAQAGLFGFGPSVGKGEGVLDANWYRHKATIVDMGVFDDTRIFPLEVGGIPVPSGAYKGGYSVGGGAVINPRLEDSFGWLLYGALGGVNSAVAALNYIGAMAKTILTVGAQNITVGLTSPPAGAKIAVRIYKGDDIDVSAAASFPVEVTGSGGPETFDFDTDIALEAGQRVDGLADRETIVGNETFTSVTQVDLPAWADAATSDIYISVGWEDAVAQNHIFEMDEGNLACIPYMGFRKYIPADCETSNYTLGETYEDAKIAGLSFTLPNNDLITARVDAIGTSFAFQQDPAWGTTSGSAGWATEGGFEDFTTVPVSTQVLGYLRVPKLDGADLPVVGAQIGWQNVPLDERTDRVYGSPFREDVTIVSRALAFQITVKWQNPDLYRAILTNSASGLVWSSVPFTARLDLAGYAPSLMTGSSIPPGFRIEARSVVLSLRGTPTLSGTDAVILQFTGTALDDPGYDYVNFSLYNLIAGYTWPT